LSSEFRHILTEAVERGSFIELVLSKKADSARTAFDRVSARPVSIKGRKLIQLASRSGAKESHQNFETGQAVDRLLGLLGTQFEHVNLFTSEANFAAHATPGGKVRVHRSPATKQPAAIEHDRSKNYLIPDGVPCPFLIEIGVMTPAGRVKSAKRQKFRQVNRFLELVNDIIENLPTSGPINVVDFGCGKSYLTFALHHLLRNVHEKDVAIVGLDRNAEVIRDCARIAEKLGCAELDFRVGTIADHAAEGSVDLAVSLHACDTATDDALAQAVRWQAPVILAVPCCQHELAERIENGELSAVERHGILHERWAALATDALRAEALEICGYRTQVIEFIDMEHTAKNLLIRAVRRDSDNGDRADRVESYRRLKNALGLDEIYLEQAFGAGFRSTVCS
jgi:SAM-dependent methyltransferase